jgi:hypothetical protein
MKETSKMRGLLPCIFGGLTLEIVVHGGEDGREGLLSFFLFLFFFFFVFFFPSIFSGILLVFKLYRFLTIILNIIVIL